MFKKKVLILNLNIFFNENYLFNRNRRTKPIQKIYKLKFSNKPVKILDFSIYVNW